MSDIQSIQFLLEDPRSDAEIISAMGAAVDVQFETLDHQLPDAKGVIQTGLHEEGFRESCLASWPGRRTTGAEQVARVLAAELDVAVLVEKDDGEWLLAKPGQPVASVEVVELDDGLDVAK